MKLTCALLLMSIIWTVLAEDLIRTKKTRALEISAEEEKQRDPLGFDAIADIHKEMDDDHSGSIDRAETSGFMAEDMNMRSTERARREKAFHGEDDAITIDDLWEAWFESPERAWTTPELVAWLSNVVNLPQYAAIVDALHLDGRILPRLAVLNSSFMADRLNIKSSVHRQKLRLSSLDVVLFGYREQSSRGKDAALALLMVLLSVVIALLVRQRRRATKETEALTIQLSELHSMKSYLEEANEKMKENDLTHRSTNGQEVQILKSQLDEAYKKLEMTSGCSGTAPLILQPLLRKTCEVELNNLNKLRAECVVEMKAAIEDVDRLRKKQTSLVANLKLVTGASSGSDHIDARIFNLKSRMEAIQSSTREAQERWLEIEALAGFPILYVNAHEWREEVEETWPLLVAQKKKMDSEVSSSSSVARSKVSVATGSNHSGGQQTAPRFYRSGHSEKAQKWERVWMCRVGSSSSMASSADRATLQHSNSAPLDRVSVKEETSFLASRPPPSAPSIISNNNRLVVGDSVDGGEAKKRKRDLLKSIFRRPSKPTFQ